MRILFVFEWKCEILPLGSMIGIPIPGGVQGKPGHGTQSSGVRIKCWTLILEGFSNLWNSIIL